MGFLVGLCVLTLAVGFVKTEEFTPKEFALNGTLKLWPVNPPTPIESITWKHQGNLLAERYKGMPAPEYYGQFKGRTSLDFSTGEITISNVKREDDGKYTIEINNVIQNAGYQVKIIREVPVPTVEAKPLSCSETSASCSLHCEGDVEGAGTVSYFWKEGDQNWRESSNKKEIKNDADTQKIKEFFCKVKNSVSEKESAAKQNPFYKEEESPSGGKVAGIVIGVFVVIGVVVAFFLNKKYSLLSKIMGKKNNTTDNELATAEEKGPMAGNSGSKHAGSAPGSHPQNGPDPQC